MYGYSLNIKMDSMSSYVALHLNWTLCSKSSLQAPIEGPTIESNSNTNYPELAQTPQVQGHSALQDCPPHQISATSLRCP